MNVSESVRMALDSILSNKLRSLLTMLGVVIGVASMQTMVALIEGAKKDVVTQLQGLGSQSIYVTGKEVKPEEAPESEWRGHSRGLRLTDVEALEKLPGVREARPQVQGVQAEVAAPSGKTRKSDVNGVSPKEGLTPNMVLVSGRFILQPDMDSYAKVAVLGATVRQDLFGDDDPVGIKVSVNGVSYEVIGTLEKRGGRGMQNDDNAIFVPLTTAQKRILGGDQIPIIVVEGDPDINIDDLTARVKTEMKALHSNIDDIETISQKAILQAVGKVLMVISLVLGGVGGLSLLVGGIGIMNIMLVTVTERTREIGIRKAIGARKRDILAQFVIESIVLSGVGGILGILFGLMLTKAFGAASHEMKFYVPLWALCVSFLFAFGTGAFFGIYPAVRAANLDPIEALRYD
jgi:putative ABC transport system permease protein